MSAVWTAYRLVAPALGAAAPAARLFAPAAERALWAERLWRGAAGPVDAWIHAASLGEALAVGPLVRALTELSPRARVHLTANTTTGRARLGELGHPYSLAPLDAPQTVGRFLRTLRPRRLFLLETELWPHWLLQARASAVPVAVISARITARSLKRYARLGAAFRSLIAGLDGVLGQSDADAERWRALGARPERTAVVGNLKEDALAGPAPDRAEARRTLGLDPKRPLLVLGSLRPGEAWLLGRAWTSLPEALRARWQVVAVPRHARAALALRAEAAAAGVRSADASGGADGAWRWDERMGVLAGYYAAADVAVVGGSLAPFGGHNPLEPAACGAPVLVGPHHATQGDAVAALVAAGGARVVADAAALTDALARWLGDEGERTRAGAAARATVRARGGASRRAVERLGAWGLWP